MDPQSETLLAPTNRRSHTGLLWTTRGRSYRLVKTPQHDGCSLGVFAGQTFCLGLVVHRVVEVDRLFGHLQQEEEAFFSRERQPRVVIKQLLA